MKIPASLRFNPWPVAIIAWFAIFMTFTVIIVTYLSRQKVDLVQTDYYDDEIRYQEQLDRLNRTEKIKSEIAVVYDSARKAIAISLPGGADQRAPDKKISGHIRLYRPANQALDREIKLSLDNTGSQIIDTRDLAAGLWKVRIYWSVGGQDFYFNQAVRVGAKGS